MSETMFNNLPIWKARHHAALFAALFVSDRWHNSWLDYKDSKSDRLRRFAIACKAKGLVEYDRTLCGEERWTHEAVSEEGI